MNTKLNAERPIKDLKKCLEDIVDNLGGNCEMRLDLRIEARSKEGFPSDVVDLINENLKSLNEEGFFE